jgi:deoxyribose-phosphate aldolase
LSFLPFFLLSEQSHSSEAAEAITNGALEIDVVFPIGLLLSTPTPYSQIYHHLKTIIAASHPRPVKVIIETSLLPTPELKITACRLATEAGAATREDVWLMRVAVGRSTWGEGGERVKVKASGGVRTFEACVEMFKAGAERIGT